LQQGRAGGKTAVSTWPDFAANDCSSCHQSLRLNSDRDPLSDPDRRGAAKIARWDIGALQLWASARRDQPVDDDRATATSLLNHLDSVQAKIEVMHPPDRLAFDRASTDLRKSLPIWFQSQTQSTNNRDHQINGSYNVWTPSPILPPRLSDLLVRSAGAPDATETWEAAAQLYLLVAASRYEWTKSNGSQLHTLAATIRRGLSLPPQIDSPRYSLSASLGSELTREQMRQLVEQVVRTLNLSNQPLRQSVESVLHRPTPAAVDRRPVSLKDASHASVR
jgi:hypothetical protein